MTGRIDRRFAALKAEGYIVNGGFLIDHLDERPGDQTL